jgi:hypothetical protein
MESVQTEEFLNEIGSFNYEISFYYKVLLNL